MSDSDVEQAARALAETHETASRGIIYEHTAGIPSAERLSAEIKSLVDAERIERLQIGDADVAQVMRRIEAASRDAHSALPGERTAYLDLLKRVLRDAPRSGDGSSAATPAGGAAGPGTGLIVPGV